ELLADEGGEALAGGHAHAHAHLLHHAERHGNDDHHPEQAVPVGGADRGVSGDAAGVVASVGRDEAGPERREVGQRARPRYTEARDTAPHPGYEGTPRAWRRARKRAHNAEHDAPPSGHKPLNGANSCAFPASMAISPL